MPFFESCFQLNPIGHSVALLLISARMEGMQCSTTATAMLVKRSD
jgi:hypothetical protein